MIKLSFEDRLNEEKEDYCRFHCPVKGSTTHAVTDSYWDDSDNFVDRDIEVDIETCDHCQLDEFIRRIRDFDESIIKEQRQLAFKAGYDQGRFEEKVGCCE
jgi:hypothetical protein